MHGLTDVHTHMVQIIIYNDISIKEGMVYPYFKINRYIYAENIKDKLFNFYKIYRYHQHIIDLFLVWLKIFFFTIVRKDSPISELNHIRLSQFGVFEPLDIK